MAYRYSPAEREALQERASTATAAGLAEARDYLMQSLTQLRLPYAFMGGYSLVLRQSPRPTQDLDIAVQANMQQIRQFVDGQARLMVPNGPVSGVIRIFVKCGPIQRELVEVDLILAGTESLGAPPNVAQATETIVQVLPGGVRRQFPVLNLAHTLRSKLNAYTGRASIKDGQDIAFLISKYPQEIRTLVTQHPNLFPYEHRTRYIDALARDAPPPVLRRNKHALNVA